jgi:hypothetical protein
MIIHGDFETRSTVDLKEVGLDVYSHHPTTDVWCFGYALEGGEPAIWTPKDAWFGHYLWSADTIFVAHNAPFELAIWNNIMVPRYGWPTLDPSRVRCTMAMAYAMSLPGSLENAALAVGLAENKDQAGHRLAMQMCRPRAVNGVATWWDEEEKREALYEYCKQDVRTEQALYHRLLELSASEQSLWILDHTINKRGVHIDKPAVEKAIEIVRVEVDRLNAQLYEATEGAVGSATEVAALTRWLKSQGVPIDSLAKADVIDALTIDDLPENARRALLIRQEAGKTSTAKLRTILACLGHDGRARDLFQFHAAGTGRWGGRRIQPQNMPRPSISHTDIDNILDHFPKYSAPELAGMMDLFYGPPMTCVSDCLRGMICAAPGKVLMAADFANIEGRVLAWLAGEQWKLDAFTQYDAGTGPDIYKLGYAKSFRIPVEEVTKDQRFIGKVQELACLSGDTPVLTDHGVKAMLDVTTEDQLWDGKNWVAHRGLVNKGLRETTHLAGIELTPDHLILTGQTWRPAQALVSNLNYLQSALVCGSESLPSSGVWWAQKEAEARCSGSSVHAEHLGIGSTFRTSEKARARGVIPARKSRPDTGVNISGGMPILSLAMITGGVSLTEYPRVSIAATIRMTEDIGITAVGASTSTPHGGRIGGLFSRTSSPLRDGIKRTWNSTGSMSTKDMSRGIYSSSPMRKIKATGDRSGRCKPTSSSLKPVYDLAYAGPLSRFTIITADGPLIVHNCGYQGGVGAFQTMAKNYRLVVSDQRAEEIKNAWREAHPRTVQYWYSLETAATGAVMHPGQQFCVGNLGRIVSFLVKGSFLFCKLPSGRVLTYPYPKLKPIATPWGEVKEQVHYMSVDGKTKKWQETHTYGGKLAENITQAVSRDVLAEAMVRVEGQGYPIVMHVHDEIVVEVDASRSWDLTLFEAFIAQPPRWATGLPIAVEGWKGKRYRK